MSARSAEPSGYPWQAQAWQAAQAAWQRQQLPHALLLTGPAGLGKREFAGALARFVLCAAPPGAARPCAGCRSCRLESAGNHPDLFELAVQEDKQNIAIGQVRELCQALALKSLAGGYKVAIVAPAELMTIAAANSLLKTLEEPAPQTLLILVCAHAARLPATLVSRCLRLRFAPPAPATAVQWLASLHGEADWGRLLELARGAPLAALALHAADFLAIDRELGADLAAIAQGQADPLAVAARWHKHDLQAVLDWLYGRVCDLVRSRLAGKPLACGQITADLQRRLRGSTLQGLFAYLDKLQRLRGLIDTPMNRQLALEDLLIPWCDGLARVDPEI